LELVAEGWFGTKKPIISGKTGMRNYDHQLSEYCYKGRATRALDHLISIANAKYILLSYNNEGVITDSEIKNILTAKARCSYSKNS